MKILQINNVYDFGSTGKITRDIHHGLMKRKIDSVVFYGRRFETSDRNVHKICSEIYGKLNNGFSRVTGLMYGGCFTATNRLISAINREKPDVIHLQCLNGYFVNIYKLLNFLNKNRIPTVLTLHAEFMYTANCGHAYECEKWKTGCKQCPRWKAVTKSFFLDNTAQSWNRMKEAFTGFDRLVVVSVSPWLKERAVQSPMLSDKRHEVIMNGIDTSIFHRYNDEEYKALRKKLQIHAGDKIIFHASPNFEDSSTGLKGGRYVIELAKRFPNFRFVVAGPCSAGLSVPENMILLGNITDKVYLAKLYGMSNLSLLTSKRETYSMVCAESLCCGTPIVGFKAGAPEMICIPEYSEFCEYDDIEALAKLVQSRMGKDKEPTLLSIAKERYSSEKMIESYIEVYKSLLAE